MQKFRYILKNTYLVLLFLLSGNIGIGKTELQVVLYPYLPYFSEEQRDSAYCKYIERKFESAYPDIDLVFLESIDAGRFYDLAYLGELASEVDLIEIDSVFLPALAHNQAIQVLDFYELDRSVFHSAAIDAVTYQASAYGVPHHMCAMFLFSKERRVFDVNSSSDIINFSKGGTGEVIYFGFNESVTKTAVLQNFSYGRFPSDLTYQEQDDAFSAFLSRLDLKLDTTTHSLSFSTEDSNKAFFDDSTLALVGYSDRIKSLRTYADHNANRASIYAQPLCLNEEGVIKIFTDAFVVPSQVDHSKFDAIKKFCYFMNRNEVIADFLAVADQPEKAAYPRAILPAKIDFWNDAALVEDDDLREMMNALKEFELKAFTLSPEDVANIKQSQQQNGRTIKLLDDDGFRF